MIPAHISTSTPQNCAREGIHSGAHPERVAPGFGCAHSQGRSLACSTFLSKYTFGASSHNAYLAVLRAIFNLAVSDALIAESPVRDLKERRREKPIRPTPTWDQFQSIVTNVREQKFKADAQDSANFLEFLGLAGLGQAEASSLKRGDIDFEKGCIITFRHKTKTGFAIPLYPQLRPLAREIVS